MSGSNFVWAWGLYLLASLFFWVANWRLTKGVPGWLRVPFLLLMAVLMLVPARVADDNQEMAPAWLVLLFDAFIQDDADIWRSGKPLLVFACVALVLSMIGSIWLVRRRSRKQVEEPV